MWGYCADVLPCESGGPVPLVLDLHITYDRFGCGSDPSINGHLHYPNDIDKSLNEAATDKKRKYHTDHHNNSPCTVFLLLLEHLGSYIVNSILLFLQTHRETDRFFTSSGSSCAM